MKKPLVFLALSALLSAGVSGAALGAPLQMTTTLSAIGERAVEDLRRCLSTNGALDVYYLIDDSGSLFDRPGMPGTDPNFARSEILGESLRQLANLTAGEAGVKSISWNAGFFSDDFYPASAQWRPLNLQNVEAEALALDAAIRDGRGGTTDWLKGLLGAQRELAQQKKTSKACQVLIWLTDGGLNVRNDDGQSFAAFNSLCGVRAVSNGAAPNLGLGPLYELRQSGVTVFGVLLDVTGGGISDSYQERKTWMKPLVEAVGEATINGATSRLACGDGTGQIPTQHAAGAFIEAKQLGDLALQFLRLGGLIQGGSISGLAADGSFTINPGVAKLELLSLGSPAAFALFDPSGQRVELNSKGVSVTENAGAIKITIVVDSRDDFGRWKLDGPNPEDVVLVAFSALKLEPESGNALISGQTASLKVIASVSDPDLFSVSDYVFDLQAFEQMADGSYRSIGNAASESLTNGEWLIQVTPDSSATKMNLRFEATNIRTRAGSTVLSSLATEQSLVVSLPANFPTFGPIPLDLGLLQGRLNPASGVLSVYPPVSGEAGYFCVPPDAKFIVQSDSADREDTWQFDVQPIGFTIGSDGCFEVGAGELRQLQLSLRNSQTANSAVTGFAEFTLKDSVGATLNIKAPIALETQRIINPLVLSILRAILILLGILLPLIAIYVANRLTTKVEHGRELLKASFPIKINTATGEISSATGLALKSSEIGLDHFKFQSPKPDARQVDIAELGRAEAKVSLNPLVAPWFQVSAKSDTAVFTGKQTIKKARRFKTGELAEFSGQLSKTWAVSVPKSEVMRSRTADEISGTLVVFARNASGTAPNFQERMVGVLNDAKVSGSIKAAQDELEKLQARKVKEPKNAGKSGDGKPREKASPVSSGQKPPRLGGPSGNVPTHKPTAGPGSPTRPQTPPNGGTQPPAGPPRPKPPSSFK